MEKQAHACVIDSEAHDFQSYAGTGIRYVEDDKGLYEFFTRLLPVFKERNKKKHLLQSQDLEEDEIYEAMRQYPPYFIFIADLKRLIQLVNGSEYEMKGFFKNILEKGSMHGIYFFSAVSVKDHQEIFGDELYDLFTGYKTGVHFGGNVADNRILSFEYLPYMEQTKVLPAGCGVAGGDGKDRRAACQEVEGIGYNDDLWRKAQGSGGFRKAYKRPVCLLI